MAGCPDSDLSQKISSFRERDSRRKVEWRNDEEERLSLVRGVKRGRHMEGTTIRR